MVYSIIVQNKAGYGRKIIALILSGFFFLRGAAPLAAESFYTIAPEEPQNSEFPLTAATTPENSVPQETLLLGGSLDFLGASEVLEISQAASFPEIGPDRSFPAIKRLPRDSMGERTRLNGFASQTNPDGSRDYSHADVRMSSPRHAEVTFQLFNTTSYGGAYFSYDNFGTGPKESLNLNAVFGQAMVLGLGDSGTGLGSVRLELTDAFDHRASVVLTGITNVGMGWSVDLSYFSSIDTTKITAIAFVMEGRAVGKKLNIDWGEFYYMPEVWSDPGNAPITRLPLTSGGKKPGLETFAGTGNPDLEPQESIARVERNDGQYAEIEFRLLNSFSYGGATLHYDDLSTLPIETINLEAVFPAGLVIGLANSGTGLEKIRLELRDSLGRRDSVMLQGISRVGKGWKISLDQFDEINIHEIADISLILEGYYPDVKLNLDWGEFAVPVEVNGQAYDTTTLTSLGGIPSLFASGGNDIPGRPEGKVTLQQYHAAEFDFVFDIRADGASLARVTATAGYFDRYFRGTPFALPERFILAVRGSEGGRTKVEIADIFGTKAVFVLNLEAVYRNFTLDFSLPDIPARFDRHSIASISFVEDESLGLALKHDLIKVKMPGLHFVPKILPAAYEETKERLISKGLSFFTLGKGLDPRTHFPYDSLEADGLPEEGAKFTQPTLIGFYLQILGEVVRGNLQNGMTREQALAEMGFVMDGLLKAQRDFGWRGLLPWLDLEPEVYPITTTIGLGDNANLAQSMAVAAGALELARLSGAEGLLAQEVISKLESFLDLQTEGYQAFVHFSAGVLQQAFIRESLTGMAGVFDTFLDRLANEFRGAIAFLKVRYPGLPNEIWTELLPIKSQYTDVHGRSIENLAYYQGGAFQAFWPLLRNNERDFIGFRNNLENAFVTFADHSARYQLPGFLSASQRPSKKSQGDYYGVMGVREMAESSLSHAREFLTDVASTYGIASGASVDEAAALEWLQAIEASLPALSAGEGLFDAARSNTELARRVLGIDVASTVLGLEGKGPEAFEEYLRNRDLEHDYNRLYDSVSRSLGIERTPSEAARPPSEFPDRSLAVFSRFTSQSGINNFPIQPATFTGTRFQYGALQGGFGGQFWVLDQDYDAQANQLVLVYSAADSPKEIKIEFKDSADRLLIPPVIQTLEPSVQDKRVVIQLPNIAALQAVRKILLVVDQNATQDTSGDFYVRALDFLHVPSAQNLLPEEGLGAGDLSVFPTPARVESFSENADETLETLQSGRQYRLGFDLSRGTYAGISIHFNPSDSGAGADLTALGRVVFALKSGSAARLKIEVEDTAGRRAVFYATGIDLTKSYYQFLLASLGLGGPDVKKVKRINFVADQNTAAGQGSFELYLGGILIV